MVHVIEETPEHFASIRQLVTGAFAGTEFGHNGEADLVEKLRELDPSYIGLMAIDDSDVVGHVALSEAKLIRGDVEILGLGLAPMSVATAHQKRGIGTQLIQGLFDQVSESEAAFIAVAGHPEYYPRFGFEPASRFGVTHSFEGMPQEILFLKPLAEDQIEEDARLPGRLLYHAAFGPQQV